MDNKLNFNIDGTLTYDDSNDNYPEFRQNVSNYFNQAIKGGKKLFKTNAGELFETFLNNLPLEARQNYTCNSCKHFINRYGDLVIINEDGTMESALWNEEVTPKFFKKAVKEMKRQVLKAKVVSMFIPSQTTLGYPVTGDWTHFYAEVPSTMVNRNPLLSASQVMAEKREDFKTLVNALNLYSLDTANKALTLIQSETMYRSERVLGVAKWFKELIEKKDNVAGSDRKRNVVWLAVATAPNGFTHVRSSMIGTLLDDIEDGLSTDSVSRRFAEKMNPDNYMRSQSAPSENAIYEAEKVVAKLGIEESLQRRYAKYEDIPSFLWEHKGEKEVSKKSSGGVFGDLLEKAQDNGNIDLPTTVMTWEKFNRTVLPTADSIEAKVDNTNRLMAMVTASNEDSPNILQWDNPFSWYYHGGIDAEIKRRVEEAGGRYEDNEIRVSLIWEGYTDLDIHCITPRGEHIHYSDKRGSCGGYLDLDMNGLDRNSATPVENMRWTRNAPQGQYKFFVHNYSEKVNGRSGTPFTVELEIGGQVYHYDGQPLMNKGKVTVFEFNYVRGEQPTISTSSSQSQDDSWTVSQNDFVKVNGITTSPNLWGENPMPQSGRHIFFILDGVKDTSEGKGRGFFNETLKHDLRQIRKTLELFTANTPIEGSYDATACGLGYTMDNDWNLTLRVKSNGSTRLIKIDRWD